MNKRMRARAAHQIDSVVGVIVNDDAVPPHFDPAVDQQVLDLPHPDAYTALRSALLARAVGMLPRHVVNKLDAASRAVADITARGLTPAAVERPWLVSIDPIAALLTSLVTSRSSCRSCTSIWLC